MTVCYYYYNKISKRSNKFISVVSKVVIRYIWLALLLYSILFPILLSSKEVKNLLDHLTKSVDFYDLVVDSIAVIAAVGHQHFLSTGFNGIGLKLAGFG